MPSIGPRIVRNWLRTVQTDPAYGQMAAEEVLKQVLIASLSRKHRRAYDLIASGDGLMTSRTVARRLHLSINNASNLCRHLFELDLVVREQCTDETGLFFQWKAT